MTDSLVWTPLLVPESTGDLLTSFFDSVQSRVSDSVGWSVRLGEGDHRGRAMSPNPDQSADPSSPNYCPLKNTVADTAVSLLQKSLGVKTSQGSDSPVGETLAGELKVSGKGGAGSPCMAEDDPNQNDPAYDLTTTTAASSAPRWGPQHAGAQELASQYTFG